MRIFPGKQHHSNYPETEQKWRKFSTNLHYPRPSVRVTGKDPIEFRTFWKNFDTLDQFADTCIAHANLGAR